MPTLKVTFGSPEKAKEFSTHFGIVGLKATAKADGNSVVVSSEDTKTIDFVKNMVSDIKSSVKMESMIERLLTTLNEAETTGQTLSMMLLDGTSIDIDAPFAKRFGEVCEDMSDESRVSLCALMVEGAESHQKSREFFMNPTK
jgi:hypothetical protein